MSKQLLAMLEEPSGGTSTTRFVYFFFMVAFTLAYVAVCARSGAMAPVPWEVVAIIGTLTTGKVAQRQVEREKEASANNSTPPTQ